MCRLRGERRRRGDGVHHAGRRAGREVRGRFARRARTQRRGVPSAADRLLMTRSIVLSGFMGTGKSTVGPLVAARLGLAFVDVDREIERAAGSTVREIWDREGEGAFRTREAAFVLALLVQDTPKVIAVGGGAVV